MTNKIIYNQTGCVKSKRDYSNNPFNTKKEFNQQIDDLEIEMAELREVRKNRKERSYKNEIDFFFQKKSLKLYSLIANKAKKGNDNFEIVIDRTITQSEFVTTSEHHEYAKSSKWYGGYEYDTYTLSLPIGWAVRDIDSVITVLYNKSKTLIRGCIVQAGYICNRKGLTPIFVATKKIDGIDYYYHAETTQKATDGVTKKIKRQTIPATITLDTYLTRRLYHVITGACYSGIDNFLESENITEKKMRIRDILPMLKEKNVYGLKKLESLLS